MTNKNEVTHKVPALRFPEFRNSGEWEERKLDDIFEFHSTANNSRADLSSSGDIFYLHYGDIHKHHHQYIDFSKDVTTKISSSLHRTAALLKNGDLIVADASEDTEGIAKAVEVLGITPERKAIAGLHTLLLRDSKKVFANGFRGLLFEVEDVKTQAKRLAVGTKVYSTSKTALRQLKLPTASLAEQRKIADCLSSLNVIITAQAQKIETLKAHKKGLMQQLFPAEDETVPRFRFPDFLGAGKWKEMRLGDMLKETVRPIKMNDDQDYYLVTVKRRYGGIVSRDILKGKSIKVKTQFLLQENDFLISKRQIIHNACGLVPKVFEGSIVSNEYSILKSKTNCNIEYFNWFAQHPTVSASFLRSSKGIVIEKMLFDLGDWLNMKFLFPRPPEQKKIADCLSSLDALITAQTQKLEALKTHKKGLMQGLFPVVDRATA